MLEISPLISVENNNKHSLTFEVMRAQRESFISKLVDAGSISQDLSQSGQLDRFIIDPSTGTDSLIHILVGDKNGGAHHMRTSDELGMQSSRIFASQIYNPDTPNKPLWKYRKEQRLRENGTFRCNIVEIYDNKKGTVMKKLGGSTMFPQEWSTEDVIQAILSTANTVPKSHDTERGSYVHQQEVRNVPVRVITNLDGKIITGSVKR